MVVRFVQCLSEGKQDQRNQPDSKPRDLEATGAFAANLSANEIPPTLEGDGRLRGASLARASCGHYYLIHLQNRWLPQRPERAPPKLPLPPQPGPSGTHLFQAQLRGGTMGPGRCMGEVAGGVCARCVHWGCAKSPHVQLSAAQGPPWDSVLTPPPLPLAGPGVVKQDKSSRGSRSQNTFGPTEGQNEQWREANRHRQRQTTEYRGLVPNPASSCENNARVRTTRGAVSATFGAIRCGGSFLWSVEIYGSC